MLKKLISLALLFVLSIKLAGMEKENKPENIEQQYLNYDDLALKAFEDYRNYGYEFMHNSLMKMNTLSNSFVFFNKMAKIIAWNYQRIDIFGKEFLSHISTKDKKGNRYAFLDHFCIKLKLAIIMYFIQEKSNEKYENTSHILFDILSSIDSIFFTCRLASWLKIHKIEFLKNCFKQKVPYLTLINMPYFKLLQKLCVVICELAIDNTTLREEDVDCDEDIISMKDKLLINRLFFDPEVASPRDNLSKLSKKSKNKIVAFLFLNLFVEHPDLLASDLSLNKKLSLIYRGKEKSIFSFNDFDFQEHIDNLTKVLIYVRKTNPKALTLSQTIKYRNLLGPKARSLWFLNNHIATCMTVVIIKNLILGHYPEVEEQFNRLIHDLGFMFLKQSLAILSRMLTNYIQVQLDGISSKEFAGRVEKLSEIFDRLKRQDKISDSILNYARKTCRELTTSAEERYLFLCNIDAI